MQLLMSKIYNADTFLDPKDLKIAELSFEIERLKKVITKFKEYDKKRTEELRESLIRLGQYEAEQDELLEKKKKNDLKIQIKDLKRQVACLSSKIHLQKILELGDEEALKICNDKSRDIELNTLRKKYSELFKDYKRIRDELIKIKYPSKTSEE